jgi:3-oxoacyl-(acyl-carrier-protein) synthase/acyl carrier protein
METGLEIAVIGMAGRFPGAKNTRELWANLENGVESTTFFSNEELLEAGVDPRLLEDPHYVKAGGMLTGIEYFDAAFFGYTHREAEIMDPQVRIFHECTWTALEDAGYDPLNCKCMIGLYAGAAPNIGWLSRALLSGKKHEMGNLVFSQLTQKEYLSMRVAYKLNLSGPSLFVYTTCSTSLVAVHLGYQALLNGECDIALAGGVTAVRLVKAGYMYEEGMINSPDGRCRAFDADAKGLVGADGVGVVVLKRLRDAVSEGDHIYAVIKGSAVNNDGMQKAGFSAPSVKGQAEVITMAMQMAGVGPESIGYIETHGTGTELGDPVEIEGLKRAFKTQNKGFCGIGSVKSNFGHADCAAGVAGFMKTVLTLNHRLIPPSLHFQTPNPGINFIDSPFYINSKLTPWENGGFPLRAGVSAFGQGGTNAHLILEEWGNVHEAGSKYPGTPDPVYLVALSARTLSALDKMTENLAGHFKENPHVHPADAEFTLLAGRHAFKYRKMFICPGIREAVDILETPDSPGIRSFAVQEENRPVIFLFPGEDGEDTSHTQYKNIGEELYRQKPIFQKEMDHCLEILKSRSPVRFIFQYALAKMLIGCGIKPYASIGEVPGETAAECLSGEIDLEDAVKSMGMTPAAELNMSDPTALSFSHRLTQLAKLENPVFLYFGHRIEKIEKILVDTGDFSGHLVHLVRPPLVESSDFNFLMTQIGRLWLYGINLDWERFYSGERRYRIPLSTYSFEGRRYWIEDVTAGGVTVEKSSPPERSLNPQEAKQETSSVTLYPRPELNSEYIPPTGETEIKLACIWQQVFGVETIGSRDDFFELGGDSLSVITMVSRIQKELRAYVPIPEFFDRPTIAGLAEYILAPDRENKETCIDIAVEYAEKKEYYPLSPAQERMYILQRMDENNVAYNISIAVVLGGEVSRDRLSETFDRLIDRHESLRTSFELVNDEPVQKVHEKGDFAIEYYDLHGKQGASTGKQKEQDQITGSFIKPFDLSQQPLLRVALIKITKAEHLFLMDMHHIMSDGFSVAILVKEFAVLYAGKTLTPLTFQYRDFSEWLRSRKVRAAVRLQEEYWLKEFEGGIPQLLMPIDYERPINLSFEGNSVSFQIDRQETEDLKELALTGDATLFIVLLAIYNVFLAKISGQEDIVVGTGVSGRRHVEFQHIMGMFVNTLALRNYPGGEKTFNAFLVEVRDRTLSAFENQDYQLEDLVEKVVPNRSRTRNPLFDTAFIFQNYQGRHLLQDISQVESPGFEVKPYGSEARSSRFDISFFSAEVDAKLHFDVEYSSKLFKKETIERLVRYFREITTRVLANNDIKLKDIPVSHHLLSAGGDNPRMELNF